MDPQQTEQINKLANIDIFEAQRLLLQQGGTNKFHENPRPEVVSSSKIAWLLNADSKAADFYNGSISRREIHGRGFYIGSMDSSTAEAQDIPLQQELGSTIGINYIGEGNSLISTQSRNGATVSNDIIPLNFLQYVAPSAGAAQQLNNIACRNPNLPLAAQCWENGENKADPKYIMNYVTGCNSNQQDASSFTTRRRTLPFYYNQASHDSTSSYDEKEGLCRINYLDDTMGIAHADHEQVQQSSWEFDSLACSYSHPGYRPAASSVGILRSSKYLRAAQQLLEDVCNVKLCYDRSSEGAAGVEAMHFKSSIRDNPLPEIMKTGPASTCRKQQSMSGEERCQLQMRKAQLIGMVETLDQRYQQYHDQMQLIVTSFESATGMDAAAPYIALPKKFISRQFRVLRDAIAEHIHGACRMLGEDISSVPILNKGETPRLRILDQRVRHRRTLQQVGMLSQHHRGWRPQRGLPERSVEVLRAWLFEHFLHPYPKNLEKLMLARLTGLTRSQVANWFINARVRLWKPMVEQMYEEERKEAESQNQAGAAQHEDMSITEYHGSCGGFKGKDVMALATCGSPPKHHHYQHHNVLHEECNSGTLRSSIMTKHGVSLTLALQHSSSVELAAPNTYKPNHLHYLLHPVSGDNVMDYNITDAFS